MGNEARERVEGLFKFLKEFAALRSGVVSDIRDQQWVLYPQSVPVEVPGVSVSYRDVFSDEEPSAAPLVVVTKPEFEKCPQPDELIIGWLEKGWSQHDKDVAVTPVKRSIDDFTGEVTEEKFDELEARVIAFERWKELRSVWVERQRPIAAARSLFVRLYNAHADLERDPETLEMMAGTGFVRDRLHPEINHPLLLKKVRIEFDASENAISIVDTDASPELYTRLIGAMDDLHTDRVPDLERELEERFYHPFDRNESAQFLERLVHLLSPDSVFMNSPAAYQLDEDVRLVMTMQPVLFVRKKIDGTVKAIERIIEDVENDGPIPSYLVDIVVGGEAEPAENFEPEDIESALAAVGGEDVDILLSKEANREQLEIARRIENHSAVLVQGPPGTGKTHTIANLMGHLLSQGKSILVVSHTQKALSVLKGKLPKGMQGLCVSILDDNNEDLGRSVNAIGEYLGSHTAAQLRKRVQRATEEREETIRALANVRGKIFAALHEENGVFVYNGESVSPSSAAKFVHDNKGAASARVPGSVKPGAPLPLSLPELDALYYSNGIISVFDESELTKGLPCPDDVLTPQEFARVWEELSTAAGKIEKACEPGAWTVVESSDGEILIIDANFGKVSMSIGRPEPFRELLAFVEDRKGLEEWRVRAAADGRRGGGYLGRWDTLFGQIKSTNEISDQLISARLGKVVTFEGGFGDPVLAESLRRTKDLFDRKGKVNRVDRMMNKGVDRVLAEVKVNGQPVGSAEDCALALGELSLLEGRANCRAYWSELMSNYGAPAFDDLDQSNPERVADHWISSIEKMLNWYGSDRKTLVELMENAGIEPVNAVLRESPLDSEEADVRRTLEAVECIIPRLCRIALAFADRRSAQARMLKAGEELSRGLRSESSVCAALVDALRSGDLDAYGKAYDCYQGVYGKAESFEERCRLIGRLREFAPGWSAAIELREGIHGEIHRPEEIAAAWKCRQLEAKLDEIYSVPLRDLQNEATRLSAEYRMRTSDLAESKAWLALLDRTEGNITLQQALNGWKLTMDRIGKGKGRRAAELKEAARCKMAECQHAVPAWIMTTRQALDTLDPRKNKFDIVIMDEASQADITALAVTYMGRKVVVVGDDRQVSPMAVGIDTAKVAAIRDMHVDGIFPNRDLYEANTSLYDIAKTSFQPLMLREHFRCVPDIIGYSNMLSYDFKIKPLRESGTGGLLPATVAYRAESGFRDGRLKKNRGEAEAIVDLMLACMGEPEYRGKTFGVISMLGDGEQVKLINEVMVDRGITLADMQERRILVGEPPMFQGDERDVVFLSLVESNQGDGPVFRLGDGYMDSYKKRYNVAVSRARDQIWVVHSFDPENDLKPGDIRRTLIEYASNPAAFRAKGAQVERLADSPFEEAVGKALISRGYRIEQQWPVGSYRIDIVVIGENGRIAIECDGERWHSGEEKAREDMERQAILERIGWRFVRIRGSEYYRDPEAAMGRVFRELAALGVEPIGSVSPDSATEGKSDLLERVIASARRISASFSDDQAIVDRAATIQAALSVRSVEDSSRAADKPCVSAPAVRAESTRSQKETSRTKVESRVVETTPVAKPVKPSNTKVLGSGARAGGGSSVSRSSGVVSRAGNDESRKETPRAREEVGVNKVASQESSVTPSSGRSSGVRSQAEKAQTAPRPSMSRSKDRLCEAIESRGFSWVDKRPSGGSLWILGDESLRLVVKGIQKETGVMFTYSANGGKATSGKPGWYSRGQVSPKTEKRNPAAEGKLAQSEVARERGVRVKAKQAPFVPAGLSKRCVNAEYTDLSLRFEIESRMKKVLQDEAPIERQRLFNIVRGSLGFKRSGSEIQSHNEWILGKIPHKETRFGESVFIWLPNQSPEDWAVYRSNGSRGERSASEIPLEEILAAIMSILSRQAAAGEEDLVERLKSEFGFKRAGENLRSKFRDAIAEAEARGVIVRRGSGRITIRG